MDLDECHDMIQCKYNGTCFNTYGDYFCRCPENFSGRHCEVYLPQNHELVNNFSNLVYVPYEKNVGNCTLRIFYHRTYMHFVLNVYVYNIGLL